MARSRLDNSLKNIKVGVIGQLLVVVTQYIARQVLVHSLPIEYVGYSGLFTNILLILSLAELGMGTAIVYCLYEPLAKKNYGEVSLLLGKIKKIYMIIAGVVAICGFMILPFLQFLITDTVVDTEVRIIYLMYLANTVASYAMAYRRSLYNADQRNNVVLGVKYACMAVECALQAFVVFVFKNYYLYMLVLIFFTLLQNIIITIKAGKEYGYIINADTTNSNIDYINKKLYKNIGAMALHKFGGVIVMGTDNLLISKFVGIVTVGIYSNYLMIRKWIESAINTFFNGIVASVGNLSVTDSTEKVRSVFELLFYVCGWVFAFCAISLYELYNPFISAWLGKDYLLDDMTRMIIVVNFYLSVMRQPIMTMKNATGQFWNDRYIAVAEALVNLVASIILGKYFGIFGILLGTTISTVTTVFIAEPIIIYKNIFKVSPVKYYAKYLEYVITMLVTAVVVHLCCSFSLEGWLDFLVKAIVCAVVSNVMLFAILFRKKQFGETKILVMKIIKKVLKKA